MAEGWDYPSFAGLRILRFADLRLSGVAGLAVEPRSHPTGMSLDLLRRYGGRGGIDSAAPHPCGAVLRTVYLALLGANYVLHPTEKSSDLLRRYGGRGGIDSATPHPFGAVLRTVDLASLGANYVLHPTGRS